jgi:preprotein translocase subunit SecF
MTSGTTLVAVGTLYFLGGEVLKGFSFILLIGIVVGTYSSVYIASPVVLLWERWVHHRSTGSAG